MAGEGNQWIGLGYRMIVDLWLYCYNYTSSICFMQTSLVHYFMFIIPQVNLSIFNTYPIPTVDKEYLQSDCVINSTKLYYETLLYNKFKI